MVFMVVFLVLLCGMWKGVCVSCLWFVSFVVVVVIYFVLFGVWYVVVGVCVGLIVVLLWELCDV